VKKLNPFSGPGSLQADQQQRRREQFKTMVWAIVMANVVLFMGLLIQGCQQEPPASETSGGTPVEAASSDTNGAAAASAKSDTHAPVATAPEGAPTNILPEATPKVAPTTPPRAAGSQLTAPASTAQSRYVVKSGDTLSRIARAHKTTVQALKAANGLTSDRVVAGQTLKMPESREAGAAGAQG
jgi:LysM repeat protein